MLPYPQNQDRSGKQRFHGPTPDCPYSAWQIRAARHSCAQPCRGASPVWRTVGPNKQLQNNKKESVQEIRRLPA